MALKSRKYLGIHLTKEVKNLNTENYKPLLKEIKEDINDKTSHIHGLEDLILLNVNTTQNDLRFKAIPIKSQKCVVFFC